MHLGEIINEYRNKHGLSMDDFAEKSGISKAYISILEKNRHPRDGKPVAPSDEMYMKVARAINMKIDELLKIVGKDQYIIINADNQKSTVDSRLIDKYKTLDYHGKKAIDTLLEIEHERCTETSYTKEPLSKYIPKFSLPMSAGSGEWDGGSDSEMVEVPLNDTTARATLIAPVSGDSMSPLYKNKDKVFIQSMPEIEEGEIGAWVVNGELFIKKLGNGELISVNSKFDNIPLNENDDVRCVGKVIGKV